MWWLALWLWSTVIGCGLKYSFKILYYFIPRTHILCLKFLKRTIKTSIVITYQDTALEEYVDQDYLWMLCISAYSTSSLMSDSMGYREVGGIGFEARMEGFLRLWRILKNMDYEYACWSPIIWIVIWMMFLWPCKLFYLSYLFSGWPWCFKLLEIEEKYENCISSLLVRRITLIAKWFRYQRNYPEPTS